jgi:hypothetical protein
MLDVVASHISIAVSPPCGNARPGDRIKLDIVCFWGRWRPNVVASARPLLGVRRTKVNNIRTAADDHEE